MRLDKKLAVWPPLPPAPDPESHTVMLSILRLEMALTCSSTSFGIWSTIIMRAASSPDPPVCSIIDPRPVARWVSEAR